MSPTPAVLPELAQLLAIVQEIAKDPPLLHDDEQGKPISWGIGPDVLSFLAEHVKRDFQTLETGSGLSTLIFAAAGAHHRCVTPSQSEVERIKSYCERKGIAIGKVSFLIGPSEQVVPHLDGPDLDVILIDGRHGFPTPFIDWYYTARLLKIGGYVLVDDTQLWPCAVLRDFLNEEPEWRVAATLGKTSVFVKVQHGGELKEWNYQPYTVSRSQP